ncbi:HTH-type transcriptional regulator gltC [Cedecea neteri]|uniref:HTH-type transcriptional regulator gltC n=1 Tax=Cedecea neteri TaxID=158822 RepID=A0A2X3JB39_9ENTR|nr:HTH-type transcriptional regulator gltC [Cedecea neteri]
MKFTLRQLEFFIALAQTKQISKAATRCHISQSSMTVAMRNLEEALNSQLFLRQPKGVQLTPSGERFLLHARKIISDSQHAIEDLQYQPELASGELTIGIAKDAFRLSAAGNYQRGRTALPADDHPLC